MKVLAFGDSFVKMFIHCEPEVKHWKFKGKSVKGLVKEDDLERRKIQREVRKTQTGTKILMFFGQVDFNYVRYYKVINGQPPITEQIFKKYIEWVSSMNNRKNISIVSIFPSPIQKGSVISSLINKGSYLPENQTAQIDQKILEEYQRSAATWQLWNRWISNFCHKYGVNNIKLFKQNRLQPEFYDISKLTIHLRYVPVLKLVQNYIDIKFDAIRAQQIQKQYEAEKVTRIVNSNLLLPGQQQGKRQVNTIFNSNIINEMNLSKILIPRKTSQLQEAQIAKTESEQQNQTVSIQSHKVQQKIQEQQQEQKVQVLEQEKVLQEAVTELKNQRKQTADLDTDTNLEKQSQKSRQNERSNSKFEEVCEQVQNTIKSETESQKRKSKKQKRKKSKGKKEKQKKKYIEVEKSESSQDEGQIFLQLACKGKRKY